MRWPPLIGLGLYVIFIAITWAGLPIEIPWFDARLAALDVMVFQPNIVYPSMLLIGAGFGLGYYVPRFIERLITKIERLITKRRRYNLEKLNHLERTRSALDAFEKGVQEHHLGGPKEPI